MINCRRSTLEALPGGYHCELPPSQQTTDTTSPAAKHVTRRVLVLLQNVGMTSGLSRDCPTGLSSPFCHICLSPPPKHEKIGCHAAHDSFLGPKRAFSGCLSSSPTSLEKYRDRRQPATQCRWPTKTATVPPQPTHQRLPPGPRASVSW